MEKYLVDCLKSQSIPFNEGEDSEISLSFSSTDHEFSAKKGMFYLDPGKLSK